MTHDEEENLYDVQPLQYLRRQLARQIELHEGEGENIVGASSELAKRKERKRIGTVDLKAVLF